MTHILNTPNHNTLLTLLRTPLWRTDSYKLSHFLQYPPNTTRVSSYIEARGGRFDETVFFGLQAFVKETLMKPITMTSIDLAEKLLSAHGVPFNRAGWEIIVNKHNGYLPIKIEAVPEGMVMPTGHVQVQVVNTDPDLPWLTSYVETALLRAVWYPSTVATLSREAKKIIYSGLMVSADDPDAEILFKLHDFGARGASSAETAMLGGMAHLVNFMGTDTLEALIGTMRYYKMDEIVGYSIPATEHSTVTSWGREGELDMFRNYLEQHPEGIIACVSDSYDVFKASADYWGTQLKEAVLARDGTLVVRPDSGDPTTTPLKVIEILMDKFGFETNSKGYKVLPPQVRVIQGDGMNIDSIGKLTVNALDRGLSTENFAMGMGGGLLQKVDRDTCKYAMKANAVEIDGEWRDVYKDPITDQEKKSKKGRLALIRMADGTLKTIRKDELPDPRCNLLRRVYEDGKLFVDDHFDAVRERAAI